MDHLYGEHLCGEHALDVLRREGETFAAAGSGKPSELYPWLGGGEPGGSVRMEGEASLAHSLRARVTRLA